MHARLIIFDPNLPLLTTITPHFTTTFFSYSLPSTRSSLMYYVYTNNTCLCNQCKPLFRSVAQTLSGLFFLSGDRWALGSSSSSPVQIELRRASDLERRVRSAPVLARDGRLPPFVRVRRGDFLLILFHSLPSDDGPVIATAITE